MNSQDIVLREDDQTEMSRCSHDQSARRSSGAGDFAGRLISNIETQHRHQEWLAFLKKINWETLKGPVTALDRG